MYDAFFDELMKIASVQKRILEWAAKNPKAAIPAAIAATAATYHTGGQALQDWKLGRTIRKQQSRR